WQPSPLVWSALSQMPSRITAGGNLDGIWLIALQTSGDGCQAWGHASKEMGGGQLTPLAQQHLHKFGRTECRRFDFEVVPDTAGLDRVCQMEQLLPDRAPITSASRTATAGGEQ